LGRAASQAAAPIPLGPAATREAPRRRCAAVGVGSEDVQRDRAAAVV